MATRPDAADSTVVLRLYAVSGAAWGVVAASLGLWLAASLAWARSPGLPALGAGRLQAAAVQVGLLGAISLPLAGALLALAGQSGRGARQGRAAQVALGLWNLGVALSLVLVCGGHAAAEAYCPPSIAAACLVVAGWFWSATYLRSALSRPGPLPVAHWFGIAAALGIAVYPAVGLLALFLGGAGQAVAGAVFVRDMQTMWAALAGVAVAAAAIPRQLGRPLFGRRVATAGWLGWLAIAPLAAAHDLAPDLLPRWLSGVVLSATVLMAAPALLVAVAIAGTVVAVPRRPPSGAAAFLLLGVVAWCAAVATEAATIACAWPDAQFTMWLSPSEVWPALIALGLLAIGASFVARGPAARPRTSISPGQHLALCVAAAVALVAPDWIGGLAEMATGAQGWLGQGGRILISGEAALLLPGAVLAWFATMVWLRNLWPAPGAAPAVATARLGVAAARGSPTGPAAISAAVVTAAIGILASLFLPLTSPSMLAASDRATAREAIAGGVRAMGRAAYVSEGCALCHTQRVRSGRLDEAYGPATRPGDYGTGPALAGNRRRGADLAWVGDRFPDRQALTERLGVHGADGLPAYPWLFGPEGPSAEGAALVDYLLGLTSGTASP